MPQIDLELVKELIPVDYISSMNNLHNLEERSKEKEIPGKMSEVAEESSKCQVHKDYKELTKNL